MGKMKKEFSIHDGFIEIWDIESHNGLPFVRIVIGNRSSSMTERKDLERFAVNILKALKSKKLKG